MPPNGESIRPFAGFTCMTACSWTGSARSWHSCTALRRGGRADWLLQQFRALGLSETTIDDEGNVLGLLPVSASTATRRHHTGVNNGQRAVVLSAHIDTVFPAGTEVDPQNNGTRLVAPGACDNAAGVTGLLAIAAA